ncbi:MAG: DMT family transporter [Chromatiales bacterium]|jgi:drug/metabolite transporter (DMT)-like permease|nr:DMT family transporter [Chromatiales bacterium]
MRRSHRPLVGIAFVAMAILLMTGQDAILKWMAAGYATMQILAIRGTVVALIAIAVVWMEGGVSQLRTTRPWGHAVRCLLNVVTVALFVTAVGRLPLADVMAIVMAAPLFTLALSTLLLGERVGPRRWLACIVGFAGVLVMLRPSGGAFNLGGAAALASSFGYSLMVIQTRSLTSSEGTGTMLFYPAVTVLTVSTLCAPFYWVTPLWSDVALLLFAGLIVGVGHYCFVQGYRYSTPGVLAPIDYTALLWGTFLGWLIWNELPDAATLLGAALVVCSGLYVIHREARVAQVTRAAQNDDGS